jgi:hypothetical protein
MEVDSGWDATDSRCRCADAAAHAFQNLNEEVAGLGRLEAEPTTIASEGEK